MILQKYVHFVERLERKISCKKCKSPSPLGGNISSCLNWCSHCSSNECLKCGNNGGLGRNFLAELKRRDRHVLTY